MSDDDYYDDDFDDDSMWFEDGDRELVVSRLHPTLYLSHVIISLCPLETEKALLFRMTSQVAGPIHQFTCH